MASGTVPHLISVAKYNKYALRGVLGFDAKGGHITYENTYQYLSSPMQGSHSWHAKPISWWVLGSYIYSTYSCLPYSMPHIEYRYGI